MGPSLSVQPATAPDSSKSETRSFVLMAVTLQVLLSAPHDSEAMEATTLLQSGTALKTHSHRSVSVDSGDNVSHTALEHSRWLRFGQKFRFQHDTCHLERRDGVRSREGLGRGSPLVAVLLGVTRGNCNSAKANMVAMKTHFQAHRNQKTCLSDIVQMRELSWCKLEHR